VNTVAPSTWLLSAWLAAAMLFMPLSAAAQEIPTPTQNAIAGARVFGAKGCTKCHAVTGEGGSVGPDLKVAARARTFNDLAAGMWNHLPRMVTRMEELGIERPRLNPREAGDLIAYLYSLDYFDPPGDPARGRELFSEKQCIRCHQVKGIGGVVGPNLDYVGQRGSPIEIATAMWNHAPAMLEAARTRQIPRPAFTGSELRDLLAYLEEASPTAPDEQVYALPGRASRGREILQEKGCTGCHGTPGRGGLIGSDLAARGRSDGLSDFMAAMWNKMPGMLQVAKAAKRELPKLHASELADIVAYLYSVNYFTEAGNARRGRNRIGAKGCLECHSLGGRGGGRAGDLAQVTGLGLPASVVAALWNHTLVAGPESAPTWPSLTAAEMADLIAFFQAISE
jgi:mono/diheme cytochrome c family protein